MKKREWLLLGAYVALIVALSFNHEMWRDEVRALSVAIDGPSWGAMVADLSHEGHPSLWYVILRAGYMITHSNLVLPVAALTIATGAAYLILRFAPFPFWIRAFAVFGAFLGYQLSVVARSYGLGVLLMIAACIVFRDRDKRPWLLALILALMANTSLHAAIAAVIILGVWLLDLLDSERRSRIASAWGLGSIAIVGVGIVVAYITARPSHDMVWGSTVAALDFERILRAITIDPGKGLMGYRDANIAAVGEYPWRLVGVDPGMASRLIVEAVILWLLWSLRRNWKAIVGIVVSIVAFEIVFRAIYSGAPWHEGLLAFLVFAICWITSTADANAVRAASRGLLPLFALQALALPVVAQRVVRYEESGSQEYGDFIKSHPEYRNAILMSEPDYFMEPLRYYVNNRIYMPRQAEFASRAYFGERRSPGFSLSQLENAAQVIACQHKVPVLVAIGTRDFASRLEGQREVAYRGTFFWTAEERTRFAAAAKRVATFPDATSDEVYEVFEISGCGTLVVDQR